MADKKFLAVVVLVALCVRVVATTDDGRPRPRTRPPRPEHIHDQVLRIHEGPASERVGQCRREQVFFVSAVNSLFVPCDRKRVQPGTLVHVPGEVGHVIKTILC